jgi:hypothetical protein
MVMALPAFFFQHFSDTLSPCLSMVFNNTLNHPQSDSSLATLFLSMVSSLWFQKKFPTWELCLTFTPYSLLNLDYKILSKSLNGRLQSILPHIIHPNQTGYVKGRFLLTNALALRMAASHKILVHCFDDFQMAFDSMSHEWISEVNESFQHIPNLHQMDLNHSVSQHIFSLY